MQFSDTTNKQGLLQDCEFWTGLGDAVITGDTALKAEFTRLINIRYAKTFTKLQLLSGISGAEDTNYADEQFSTFDIVSGQNSYQFKTDEDGNTITDITGILIKASSATDFTPLKKLTLDATDALLFMSPNASNTGTPTGYIEKNNVAYFDYIPDYSSTGGGKVFYRLVPSYFVAGDTTKKPGFQPDGCHRILSVGASLDWLLVNKSESTTLIQACAAELRDLTADLESYTRLRNPTRARLTGARHSSR